MHLRAISNLYGRIRPLLIKKPLAKLGDTRVPLQSKDHIVVVSGCCKRGQETSHSRRGPFPTAWSYYNLSDEKIDILQNNTDAYQHGCLSGFLTPRPISRPLCGSSIALLRHPAQTPSIVRMPSQ